MDALIEPYGGGWSYFKRGGRTVLRVASVPAWGGVNRRHGLALYQVAREFKRQGFAPVAVKHLKGYTAHVMSRDGLTGVSYADVLAGKG